MCNFKSQKSVAYTCMLFANRNIFYRDAQVAVKQLLELPAAPTDGDDPDEAELSARLLYKCPVCMRKFRGSNYLKLHMRNHTGWFIEHFLQVFQIKD